MPRKHPDAIAKMVAHHEPSYPDRDPEEEEAAAELLTLIAGAGGLPRRSSSR
jgi:hypothetical protein